MKQNVLTVLRCLPWLLALFLVDAFAVFLLWVSNLEALFALSFVIVLFTVILFVTIVICTCRREKRRIKAFENFINSPDTENEEMLIRAAARSETDMIRYLGRVLREDCSALNKARIETKDYRDYVELWAHETKTPLSLLTLVLDNRSDELPPEVVYRLDYIRNRFQENINRMLFYARLSGTNKDYLFETVDLALCIEDVLEDYRPLLEEKKFAIESSLKEAQVYTDRRGITFIFSQVIGNAVKYCSDEPVLFINCQRSGNEKILLVRDNGTGVKSCDLPYIFEKGFTGSTDSERMKSTGMGLYLSRKIAEDLNIRLEPWSKPEEGFEMKIVFPEVE